MVETPGTSSVGLALLPNVLVHLDRGARLEIVRLAIAKDGNETGDAIRGRFVDIKLSKGRLVVSQDWGEARAQLSVITPQGAVVTPANALFIVESEPGKVRITCAGGWVEFRPAGAAEATRIPPGSIGQWPSANGNIAAADAEPRGQDSLQQATELEAKLRNLAAQKRNVLPR